MKLSSLLILTKNTRKSKNNFKAPKKSEIVIFLGRISVYCHVNKTSQQYTALYTTFSHALDGEIRATLIVCPTLGRRHQYVAQCCRNIQPSFSKCLGLQKVCLGFKRFHKNIDIKYFFKFKNSEKNKIMIWGIHYFITKLKTKIYVIPRSCFNLF